MADLGRRRFLGAAGLAAGTAACRKTGDSYAAHKPPVPIERGVRPGEERWVLTTCGLCRAGCGLRVRVVGGRAVKVEGNPESPVNVGGVCARGQAGVALPYHPERVRAPLRRAGQRGENRWQEMSWQGAIATLTAKLADIRTAGEPQSLALFDGEYSGITHALWARFMAAFGSPNHVGHGCGGRGHVDQAVRNITGISGTLSYDFEHAACVLLVGTGALESSPNAIRLSRAVGQTSRPRILCASPRLPRMASHVDTWIDIAPGTAAALLLGIAHVLVHDGAVKEAAVEMATGFLPSADENGSKRPGLRDRLLAEFSPASVAIITGVAEGDIRRIAHELSVRRPSVVAVDEALVELGVPGAAILVNALLGSVDRPGGMAIERDAFAFRPLEPDPVARAGRRALRLDGSGAEEPFSAARMLSLPQAMLSGKPYATKVLLQSYSNPLCSKPGSKLWRQAIAAVPFVVSFSPFLDESASEADLILPDHTFFERWEVVANDRAFALRQPVVPPVTSTMQTAEVILRLAGSLGGSIAEALPWNDVRQATLAGLATAVAARPSLLAELNAKGVVARDDGDARTTITDVRAISWTSAPIPKDGVRFPFTVVPFRSSAYAEGGGLSMGWLAELAPVNNPRAQQLEISVEDARRLGFENGDAVVVQSDFGSLVAVAQVSRTIRPGVLGLPLGRAEAMELLGSIVDEVSGHWLASATRAQVRKLG